MAQMIKRILFLFSLLTITNLALADAATKEWTFLVFINGHNSLDDFGAMNIKQMEKIGSSENINIVVQWASFNFDTTKRLLVQKSTDPNQVTSPVVNNPGLVDMGDYHSLVDFVTWGAKNYPAKHYFVVVWNHGSGWHYTSLQNQKVHINDISYDERSGHVITTKQLGQAMHDIASVLGQKIDIYGSDACLMSMLEVADEMRDSVSYFVGSQDLEPGPGWPYDTYLESWTKNPTQSPAEVAKLLSTEYLKSYTGGSNGTENVTMATLDLSQIAGVNQNISAFANDLRKLNSAQVKEVIDVGNTTQSFFYGDYKDISDFLTKLDGHQSLGLSIDTLQNLKASLGKLIIANDASDSFKDAHGVSIWLPLDKYTYDNYSKNYHDLQFDHDTNWSGTLEVLSAQRKP